MIIGKTEVREYYYADSVKNLLDSWIETYSDWIKMLKQSEAVDSKLRREDIEHAESQLEAVKRIRYSLGKPIKIRTKV